jgi:uncharacterized membrane protein YeaQ/YmgE (transglycosylase-associated protein family)
MTADLIVVAVAVGLLAGWLADVAMKGGGYGLIGDLLLGVGGGMVAGWIFRTFGFAPNGGRMAMVGVAFVGAVILIYAQRMLWHTHA